VELHHHDLGVDPGLALLDRMQADQLLAALLRSYVRTREVTGLTLVPDGAPRITIGQGGPPIAGAAIDVAGWLSGRYDGSRLRVDEPLPELPTW
jgi:maleylpyruvate isomerase